MVLIRIYDADTGELVCTDELQAFLAANADAPEVCEAARALKPGESVHVGGGAAPWLRLARSAEVAHRFELGKGWVPDRS